MTGPAKRPPFPATAEPLAYTLRCASSSTASNGLLIRRFRVQIPRGALSAIDPGGPGLSSLTLVIKGIGEPPRVPLLLCRQNEYNREGANWWGQNVRPGSCPRVDRARGAAHWRSRRSQASRTQRRSRRGATEEQDPARRVGPGAAWRTGGPPGVGNGGLGSRKLMGVVQVIWRSNRDCHSKQVGTSGLTGQSQHGHQGHDARSTTDEDGRSLGFPDEPKPDWSPDLELVTDHDLVMEELRDLAAVEPLHGELDLARIVRCRRHRIRPRCRVPVGCGEPHDVVLPSKVRMGVVRVKRKVLAVRVSGRISVTVATLPRVASRLIGSHFLIALVSLLEPRISPIVVAIALPESRFVVVEHPQPGHPFRTLPKVEMRDQAGGPVRRVRSAVVRLRTPRRPKLDHR